MRILVVDDDYVSRSKLSALLASYGQCDNAPNGEIALKLFEEAHKEMVPYGLITMDIEMPDIGGKEVVRRIRETERALQLNADQEARILMVTVKTALKEVSTAYHEGCNGYLTKPTTPEDLNKAMTEAGFNLHA